jgi:diguanylate cyclase (GGDEF)-like protein
MSVGQADTDGISFISKFAAVVQMAACSPPRWSQQWIPSLLTAAICIALSVIAAVMVGIWEDKHSKLVFDSIAENHLLVLQSGLNEYLNKLRAVQALFDSSNGEVSRDEFETFCRPLIKYASAIQTLAWAPRVLHSDREAHELAGAKDGLLGYAIKSIAADDTVSRAGEQNEYFPIFYATVSKTSPLYGLDLQSDPNTRGELEHARDNDQLGFSKIRAVVTAGGNEHRFIFSLPIYRQRAPHQTLAERRDNLTGFVHGSFITADMIGTIIRNSAPPQEIDLFFFAPDAGLQDAPIYQYGSRLRTVKVEPKPLAELTTGLHWTGAITAGTDRWMTMLAVPMPNGVLAPRHDRAWIILLFGLISGGGLVAYMWASGRHALRLIAANQRVAELAQIDSLTMLANRRTFSERHNQAFIACQRGAQPFGIICFDIDYFKDVNDTLGHPVGDVLLCQVADRLKNSVRNNDLVARIGGDEFAVLQSDIVDPDAEAKLADRIGKAMSAPFFIGEREVNVTASIGISRYSPEAAGPNEIMIQADLALYRAKEDGRNCVRFYNEGLGSEAQQRVAFADELRGALDRHEMEVYYQPQVEVRTGRITALEALLRWNNPKRGFVSPSIFIPIAERTGHILPLGQWVLNAACRQMRLWQDLGIAPQLIAINVSAVQFKRSVDFAQDVAESLKEWNISPGAVEIELTESVLMEVTQQHSNHFQRLRDLGVKIAIDDFGTGYSSLNYLTRYPVNRLKIAQELMLGVETDPRNAAVVRTAIRLAHELGIEIVAEGVETDGQAEFLLASGCEHAQGFYFSKPVNEESMTKMLCIGTIKPTQKTFRDLRRQLESTTAQTRTAAAYSKRNS